MSGERIGPRGLSPRASGLVTAVGCVLVTIGIGSIVRGGTSAAIGLVFVVLGIVSAAIGLVTKHRWFVAESAPPPRIARQLLGVVGAIAAGTVVYVLVIVFSDRL